MTTRDFHPLVKQLLDGDITLVDLPTELRPEGEEALRLLAAIDREPVQLAGITDRVMWMVQDRTPTHRIHFRPWLIAPALAAAAALVLWLGRSAPATNPTDVTVRFVLVAPDAHQVTVAGTFNEWDAAATKLVRSGTSGVWTATLTLPAGEHQYAFVVDGARWVPDPTAPAVDDGFGRRNSVLAL